MGALCAEGVACGIWFMPLDIGAVVAYEHEKAYRARETWAPLCGRDILHRQTGDLGASFRWHSLSSLYHSLRRARYRRRTIARAVSVL